MSDVINEIVSEILSNEPPNSLLSSEDSSLDSVIWKDFSRMEYILKPNYRVPAQIPAPALDLSDINQSLEMEAANIDSTELEYVQNSVRNALQLGITQALMNPHADVTSSYSEESGILTLRITDTYFTNKRQTKTEDVVSNPHYDLRNMVNLFMAAMTDSQFADLLEYYFVSLKQQEASLLGQSSVFFDHLKKLIEVIRDDIADAEVFYKNLNSGIILQDILCSEWNKILIKLSALVNFDDYVEMQEVPVRSNEIIHPYDFRCFMPKTYNLGLQLIHRQEWRVLGNQRGEVVRTIPLGPKQSEKVSIKIVKRQKDSRLSETTKERESNIESSDTLKSSSEIVNEAGLSLGFSVGNTFEGGVGGFLSGSGSMNLNSSAETRSRNTSTALSEAMQKTANRIRSESKIKIETEQETTFETENSSEIVNPNDEISLTYVYSKLQRQYEVFTGLSEVRPTVMVALPIPEPHEIDFHWVKRYDWIIAKVLLDDSFRDALDSIRNYSSSGSGSQVQDFKEVMDKTIDNLGLIAAQTQNLSLSNVDIVGESQKGYREVLKENIEKTRIEFVIEQKRSRLYQHIRDNILHYNRAIWTQMDPQQRLLSLMDYNVQVPQDWYLASTGVNIETILEELEEGVTDISLPGAFVGGDTTKNLAEIINPAGPIDYYGNYAIFYLNEDAVSEQLLAIYSLIERPYLDTEGFHDELLDPVLRRSREDNRPADLSNEIFTPQTVLDMISFVPDLKLLSQIGEFHIPDLKNLSPQILSILKQYYAEFRYRYEMTRRFPVDTNNLVIDIEQGNGTALEKFKIAHRGIDVYKSLAEQERMQLENSRRKLLITKERYGDPDIDKVTVVSGQDKLNIDLEE